MEHISIPPCYMSERVGQKAKVHLGVGVDVWVAYRLAGEGYYPVAGGGYVAGRELCRGEVVAGTQWGEGVIV